MLGKLVKHEWKAVGKVLGIVHFALILMAIIGKVMLSIEVLSETKVLWRMLLLVYVISVMAVGVGTHIYLAVRFYKNMYTDEGYLSFTLPVKSWQHILAKDLIASVWILIDGVIIVASIVILVMYKGMGTDIGIFIKEVSQMGMFGAGQIVITVIAAIVSLFSVPLTYYCAISVGQLFNTHKMLASVVAFFVIVNVIQVLSTLSSTMVMLGTDGENYIVESIGGEVSLSLHSLYSDIISTGMIEQLVIGAAFWLVINFIMNRKLNLE